MDKKYNDTYVKEYSYTADGVVSWYNYSGNQSDGSSENWTEYYLGTQLYHSWACTQKKAPSSNKDKCSTMFIAVLFIIARSWK